MIDLILIKYGKKICLVILGIMLMFLVCSPIYDRLSLHRFKQQTISGKEFYRYKDGNRLLYINKSNDKYIITINRNGVIIKTLYYPLVDKRELLRYIKTL